ncbi:MAG: ABC transporter ATP-binding protein [Coriobacteriia bacterium]|nr:ABC transporter ATP-binding protein [Coriobacteriia bacterium]
MSDAPNSSTGGDRGMAARDASSASSELAIDARELAKEFRALRAVDGVTLSVPRGQVFGLVGPDGAGKSTLIRMLATVLTPSSGDAFVFGNSVVSDPHAVKPRIGYMSQAFSLYGDLTVAENLRFFAELRGVPREHLAERSEKLLEFSGLTEFKKRQAQYLSGGMKQKLALAATLISEPDLLFLDEPTTGVDPVSRREFWRIISDLHRQGITVFVATPYMDEADRCNEIAFMTQGRIILRDTPAGMKRRVPGRVIEVSFESGYREAMPALRALPYVRSVEVSGDHLRVLVDREMAECESCLADALSAAEFSATRIKPIATDLEVAFATLIPSADAPLAQHDPAELEVRS